MASAGGSLKAGDVSVGTSIVPPGPPAIRRHAGYITCCYQQQLTASFHDFAVSLGDTRAEPHFTNSLTGVIPRT
jgi:hypothetical protein